ncbi:MAG: glycosyltransferase [Pseudomonadota bacterium]
MENGIINLSNRHNRNLFVPFIYCLHTDGAMANRLTPDVHIVNFFFKEGLRDMVSQINMIRKQLRIDKIDVVHTHGWGQGSLIGVVAARLAKVPVVVNGEHGGFFLKKIQIIAQRMISYWCDRTLSVSDSLKTLVNQNIGISISKITTIPNGVDIEIFSGSYSSNGVKRSIKKASGLNIEGKDFIISCVGSLKPEKNQKMLIDALLEVNKQYGQRQLKILFIGDGPDRELLQKYTSEVKLEKQIAFLGKRSDIPELLSISDVLALVSIPRWEGMSNVILEAMSSKVPVIATQSVGSGELVRDGINGFLVTPGNVNQLAERLIVLATEENLRSQMANNSRKVILDRYSIDKMVNSYENLYIKLLRRN